MKRSELNRLIADTETFIHQQGFRLPPFAFWTPERWQTLGEQGRERMRRGLGWDLTDFGLGVYAAAAARPNPAIKMASRVWLD